jgi:hypothetical protein
MHLGCKFCKGVDYLQLAVNHLPMVQILGVEGIAPCLKGSGY